MRKVILYMMMALALIVSVTAVNCSGLPDDITIEIDSQPYVSDMMSFFGLLPSSYHSQELQCWSYVRVEGDGEYIQVNPTKVAYSDAKFPLFSKREENREYFTSKNGVVSAYITYDNLVAYTEFILGVRCTDSDGDDIIGEKCVTPYYKELKGVTTRGLWATENADMLIILIIVALIVIVLLGGIYRKVFK
jgi:hypothetical protein